MKRIVPLILILFLMNCSNSQMLKTKDLAIKIKNKDKLNTFQEDFVYLTKVLKDSHPNIYKNFSKNIFENKKENVLNKLETVTDETAFQIILQNFVANIEDAHTCIKINSLFNSEKNYPLKFHWIKDKLFIVDLDKKLPDKWIGAQVINFEKYSLKETVGKCGSIIAAENNIWKQQKLRSYLRNPVFMKLMKITKTIDSLNLTIMKDELKLKITLNAQDNIKWKNPRKKHKITAKKDKNHYYKILPEERICYYQFNEFIDSHIAKYYIKHNLKWYLKPFALLFASTKYTDYPAFLDKMFSEIREKEVEKIIIDLRNNGGGASLLGDLLMYYCSIPDTIQGYQGGAVKISELYRQTYRNDFEYRKRNFLKNNPEKEFKIPRLIRYEKEKRHKDYSYFDNIKKHFDLTGIENRFKGEIILLIGPKTFSSASMFATVLSDNKQAILIGEPIGQKPTSFGDILRFKLPRTHTDVCVSHKLFQRPDSTEDDEKSLCPDIVVYPAIEDYLDGEDPVFEKAKDY